MRNDGRGPDQDYWPALIEVEAIGLAPICTSIISVDVGFILPGGGEERRRATHQHHRIELKHTQAAQVAFPLIIYVVAYAGRLN